MTAEITTELARNELAHWMRELRSRSALSIDAAADAIFSEERFIRLLETSDRDVRALSPRVPGNSDRSFSYSDYRLRELCERVYNADAQTTTALCHLFLLGDGNASEYNSEARERDARWDWESDKRSAGCLAVIGGLIGGSVAALVTGSVFMFFVGMIVIQVVLGQVAIRVLPRLSRPRATPEEQFAGAVKDARSWLLDNHRFVTARREEVCPAQPAAWPTRLAAPTQQRAAMPTALVQPQRADPAAPASASASVVSPRPLSMYDELLKLQELRERGILSEEEFQVQKAKILSRS